MGGHLPELEVEVDQQHPGPGPAAVIAAGEQDCRIDGQGRDPHPALRREDRHDLAGGQAAASAFGSDAAGADEQRLDPGLELAAGEAGGDDVVRPRFQERDASLHVASRRDDEHRRRDGCRGPDAADGPRDRQPLCHHQVERGVAQGSHRVGGRRHAGGRVAGVAELGLQLVTQLVARGADQDRIGGHRVLPRGAAVDLGVSIVRPLRALARRGWAGYTASAPPNDGGSFHVNGLLSAAPTTAHAGGAASP